MADIIVGRPGYNRHRARYAVVFHSESNRGQIELLRTFECQNGIAFMSCDTQRELDVLIEGYVELWKAMSLSIEVTDG